MLGGIIMALDMGVNLGVAIGRPGTTPESYSVRLKKPSEEAATAFANLIAFLQVSFAAARPVMLVKEAPLALSAFSVRQNSQATVRMTYSLHGVVEGIASRYGVPWREVHDATARKHFIGKARLGSRKETKRAVVERCRTLGYFGADVNDDNRADACCVFDWASATLFRATPGPLRLFGEIAA